ncbi:hypothetical protein GCM10027591_00890 [Zhihengliuella somnathii]
MKIRQLVALTAVAAAALPLASCAADEPAEAACTSADLPLKIGVPDTGTGTTYDLQFGPAATDCTLTEPFRIAYLDEDLDEIGTASTYAGTDFEARHVAAKNYVTVSLTLGSGDDHPAETCDPAEAAYLGWRFPGDTDYGSDAEAPSIGEFAGERVTACASTEHELLEVGPYTLQ